MSPVADLERSVRRTEVDDYLRRWTGLLSGYRGLVPVSDTTFETEVGAARVRVTARISYVKYTATVLTRVRSPYVLGAGPDFLVTRAGALKKLSVLLGAEDVRLGSDDAFDSGFVVKGTDPRGMRQVWTPLLQSLMRESLGGCDAGARGHEVFLEAEGALVPGGRLGAAMDLVAGLAEADFGWTQAVRRLPGGVYVAPSGPFIGRAAPMVWVAPQPIIIVRPARVNERVVTRAEVHGTRSVNLASVSWDDRGVWVGGLPDGILDPDAIQLVSGIGAATLTVTGATYALTWRGLEMDLARLTLGMRFLRALMGEAHGGAPYR